MEQITIRKACLQDFGGIWEIFYRVVEKGDTYVYSPTMDREEAQSVWMAASNHCYVAINNNEIVGTYIIKANQPDLGSHIANASFMVHPYAQGHGIGYKMALHAIEEAKGLNFFAMQFNIVVATNTAALRLWEKVGFRIVGTIPKAYQHQEKGLVDAHVMYRELD